MKKLLSSLSTIISILALLSFAACVEDTPSSNSGSTSGDNDVEPTTYTVTWVNDDGTVLEKDEGVEEGALPAYDGETYIWATTTGWSENYISSNVSEEKMERILELYDWLLSDEGFKITYYGFEGETYNMTEEGPVYTETALNDNPSISFWVQFTRWSTGFDRPEGFSEPRLDMPSIYEHLDELEKKFPDMPRQPGYSSELSTNATNAYKAIKTDFGLTPEQDFIKIMTGKDNVKDMWKEILNVYEKDGMSKVIDEVTKACNK